MSDISAVKLADLSRGRCADRACRCTHARRISRGSRRVRPQCTSGSTRSDNRDAHTLPARPTRRCIWFATPEPAVDRRMNASSRQASQASSMSRGEPRRAWQQDYLSFAVRRRSRSNGRYGSRPVRWCCSGSCWPGSILVSSRSPRSWGPGCCFPVSPIPVAWECCWHACHGTAVASRWHPTVIRDVWSAPQTLC